MQKSVIASVVSLVVVIFACTVLGFVFAGSGGVKFSRISMAEDKSLSQELAIRNKAISGASQTEDADFERRPMNTEDTPAEAPKPSGDKVVLWLSITGFRSEYMDKATPEMLNKMVQDGAGTSKMRPIFPTTTYPMHTALATGVGADKHGIVQDTFRVGGKMETRPMDPALMTAEPIWTTATRQGLRVLVHDWPLSQNQTGEHAAAVFLKEYNPELTDQQRLDALWEAWSGDKNEKKLRLIMGRINGVNNAALENGTKEDATYEAVKETDKALAAFLKKVQDGWKDLAPPNAQLVVVITTDHGMVDLEKLVNLPQLLGEKMLKHMDVAANDGVANIYFKDLPESEAEKKIITDELDRDLRAITYFKTYATADIPSSWRYALPDRVGDRVLVLKSGFSFTEKTAKEPDFEPGETSGPFAGFGYPVDDVIRMSGITIFWSPDGAPVTGTLDEMSPLVLHPTVCKLLGVEPAADAKEAALSVN
ncbi:MAG: alkaline phosphatase family protein [Verrucomicrobiales bacterium]|nr:alkaline phosphatase family protein [Verrucomicrobiales bacterium]